MLGSPKSGPTEMENNLDMSSKFNASQGDLSVGNAFGDGDPFNDSAVDTFENFLTDDFDRSNRSDVTPFNDSTTFQDMVVYTLEKASEEEYAMNIAGAGEETPSSAFALSGGRAHQSNQATDTMGGTETTNDWFHLSNTMGWSAQPNQNANSHGGGDMLDATPLNISLGSLGGGGGGGLASESSNSIASMLRRKESNSQLHGAKLGSVRKVGLTSSKLRSAKSEGMLARALKAKYNSGNSLNKFNVNAAEASAVINARFTGSSMSAMASNQFLQSQNDVLRENEVETYAVETEGSLGAKNATWKSVASRKPGASMFAHLLRSPDGIGSNQEDASPLSTSGSMASLLRQQKLSGGGSRTSMQDLLRLSKKQSKTQSMLRQSSAQSLLKQVSSQSLKGMRNNQVDLSALLPPIHAMTSLSISGHAPSPKIPSSSIVRSAFDDSMQMNNMAADSLLHQSCRLYPTTAAVVESALRIEPDAVRKAVPVAQENGPSKKSQNVYGYPINVAMTHGGSVEVIKLLIEAGPDVLVQKDGNDGAGSLAIAIMNNMDMEVIEMLVQANPDCVKVADRRGNYPLHVAVRKGLSFPLVKRLHAIYPNALQMRNFHSQTPLDIAQLSTRCSEEIMNYLQSTAFSRMEHNANHLEQHNQADLEDGLDDIMETNF